METRDQFRKVNIDAIEEAFTAREGRQGFARRISEALGREPQSTDLMRRHPFDVEILRVPPHSFPYRYHAHSAQWEYYQVISGTGVIRHEGGEEPIVAGDAFLFKPGQAHQLRNDSEVDLLVLVVADNPIGESAFYPDEKMWVVTSPEKRYVTLHPERERDTKL